MSSPTPNKENYETDRLGGYFGSTGLHLPSLQRSNSNFNSNSNASAATSFTSAERKMQVTALIRKALQVSNDDGHILKVLEQYSSSGEFSKYSTPAQPVSATVREDILSKNNRIKIGTSTKIELSNVTKPQTNSSYDIFSLSNGTMSASTAETYFTTENENIVAVATANKNQTVESVTVSNDHLFNFNNDNTREVDDSLSLKNQSLLVLTEGTEQLTNSTREKLDKVTEIKQNNYVSIARSELKSLLTEDNASKLDDYSIDNENNLFSDKLKENSLILSEKNESLTRLARSILVEDLDNTAVEENTNDAENIETVGNRIPDSASQSEEQIIGSHNISVPDTLTYERGYINQSFPNDWSAEEHRSSYSSSEEALASCDGVLLALPLMLNKRCKATHNTNDNRISYDIVQDGTYYFVFSSDNEIVTNELHFNITFDKMKYDTNSPIHECKNVTNCTLEVDFFSQGRTVVELQPFDNHWEKSYEVRTECTPRTSVYICFLLLAILLLFFCALH